MNRRPLLPTARLPLLAAAAALPLVALHCMIAAAASRPVQRLSPGYWPAGMRTLGQPPAG